MLCKSKTIFSCQTPFLRFYKKKLTPCKTRGNDTSGESILGIIAEPIIRVLSRLVVVIKCQHTWASPRCGFPNVRFASECSAITNDLLHRLLAKGNVWSVYARVDLWSCERNVDMWTMFSHELCFRLIFDRASWA